MKNLIQENLVVFVSNGLYVYGLIDFLYNFHYETDHNDFDLRCAFL